MCFSVMVKKAGKGFEADWDRDDLALFKRRSMENPKLFPEMRDRIYQGSYAPVFHKNNAGEIVVSPMRYGVYEPRFIKDPRQQKAFNARRDNLTSPYWADAYQRHHGFVLLTSFFEWVEVADLVNAGIVSIGEIKAQFERESAERKERILSAGKKYAMTATEKKDPRFRKIIIQFQPRDASDLLVPVIFTGRKLEDGEVDRGFAIVTDDPQHEVLAAGHDRSPSFVTDAALFDWIDISGKSADDFQRILDQKPEKFFKHQLVEAA